MYSIPRGDDEFSSLVSQRTAYSVPSGTTLHHNDPNELFVNYGTVNSSHMVRIHKSDNVRDDYESGI